MKVLGIDLESVVPVLSLLVFKDEGKRQVLLGVRDPSPTSVRHPGVLSTPTMRIPLSLMVELLSAEPDVAIAMKAPHFEELSDVPRWGVGVPYSLSSPQAFVAEALVCRKLGLSDELVEGRLQGELSQSALAYDVIHDDADGYENTFMITMNWVLSVPPPELPSRTPSYSRLDWVDTRLVDQAVRSKDPLLLLPDASPLEVCIHGLCVRSAAFAIVQK